MACMRHPCGYFGCPGKELALLHHSRHFIGLQDHASGGPFIHLPSTSHPSSVTMISTSSYDLNENQKMMAFVRSPLNDPHDSCLR